MPLSNETLTCLAFNLQPHSTDKVSTFELTWGEEENMFQKEMSWDYPNFHLKEKEESAFLETQAQPFFSPGLRKKQDRVQALRTPEGTFQISFCNLAFKKEKVIEPEG